MFHRAIIRRLAVIAAVLLVALPSRALFAQTGTISGKVTDAATAQPIADARVVIAGTTFEAQTNKDGDYRLTNVKPGRTGVSVFRLGYKASRDSVMVVAGQTATLNVKMAQSVINLSEVVVTGTAGNRERKAQAALVASVSAADIIKDAPITSVANLLQSRVPGVALSSQSGTKGTATQIRIRGASSINLSNQPLLFIDGVRINEGQIGSGQSGQQFDRMNDLNPEEIESIEVVKGPAAATLYGADASAGVIQIITKKGRAGSNSFQQSLRLETGSSDARYTPPANYGACTAALILSTSTNPLCRGKNVGDLVNDNPLARVGGFQTGTARVFNYSARGGGQNYGYNLSYGSDNSEGTLPNNKYNRYNVRTNVNYVANSKLNFDIGLGLVQSKIDLPDNDNNIFGWLGGGLLGSPLTRNDSPTGQLTQDGWYSNRHYNAINAIERSLLTKRVTTSITANYAPTTWFTNRVTGGLDYASDNQRSFFPKNDSLWYGGLTDGGSNASTSRGAERYTFDYLGNMKKQLGSDWETNLSFGLQVISTRNTLLTATGIGFVTNANNSVGSAATTTGGGGFTEQRQFGYLSQLQIGNQNKRFLQVGVRVDKNSSFGTTAPAFVLPKIGGSWAISEENFFEPLSGIFNTMRLRAAYGTTGRSPNPGDALTTLSAASYNISGSTSAGAIPGNPGNADLKPERGSEFEAGLDAGFFDNRVSAELTYFKKQTKDLIIARPIPPSLGFSSNPLANIGSVENSGLELALNISALNTQNVRWDIRAGANTLHNELTSLGDGANRVLPFNLGGAGRTIVGQQLGVFVSKKIESVDLATGKVIVSDTLAPMGNLFPTLEWNLSNTVTLFKNLRVSALLDAKRDFLVQNFTAFFRETQLVRSNLRLDPTALSPEERLRRYGNPTSGQPAFVTNKGNNATVNDVIDSYLEKGDFIRLREVSATYTLPSALMKRIGNRVQSASLTFAVQNVKLWSDYSGADPEINAQTNAFSRQDFLTTPNPRNTVLRFNLTF
ncbi:SusC/RagA family TonB-linked outer membrane protein [Gemmatimonas sp.]|uniref:SusC/RagA family TonB-linked outer membrane protein n=1 Tax=Gemmatimonas sp. TaxID=1962908 RepID=UPI00286DDBD8|nr:SusC/RagA family TonB-linked outer membrane protein [Gemmatimonas sp.]